MTPTTQRPPHPLLLKLIAVALAVVATVADAQQDRTTLRQDALGFAVTAPAGWSVQRLVLPDPIDELREGRFSFAMSTSPGPDAPDWNALVFNAVQQGGGTPLPFVRVSVHSAAGEAPDAFPTLVEQTLQRLGVPLTSTDRDFRVGDATGANYTYSLMATVRYVVLTANGRRVVVMAYVPAADPAAWDAVAPTVDALIQSIRLK